MATRTRQAFLPTAPDASRRGQVPARRQVPSSSRADGQGRGVMHSSPGCQRRRTLHRGVGWTADPGRARCGHSRRERRWPPAGAGASRCPKAPTRAWDAAGTPEAGDCNAGWSCLVDTSCSTRRRPSRAGSSIPPDRRLCPGPSSSCRRIPRASPPSRAARRGCLSQ